MSEIRPDMHITDYHADPAVSKSRLDLIHRSPAHYQAAITNPTPPTDAMIWGSMFHTFILQPELFEQQYAVLAEKIDRRSNEGKALWQQWQDANPGRIAIAKPDMTVLEAMRDSLMAHPLASVALTGGVAEQSIFFDTAGVSCRCRPDYWREGVLYDLKTTMDARPDEFSRSCWKFRYHVQSAFYLDGYGEATDEPVGDFVFIAVEKSAPYAVAMYHANEAMVEQGRREYLSDLDTYKRCLETGIWGGYPEVITSILLPRWAQEVEE